MDENLAKQRFAMLSLSRLGGAILVVIALLEVNGTTDWLPPILGYVFLVLALATFFVVPLLLARRWRTPPEEMDNS